MKKIFFLIAWGVLTGGAFFLPFTGNLIYCRDTGFKYSRHYTTDVYGQSPQNWTIAQDRRGVIYAGNQSGLLEYDGVSWRTIDVPGVSVRSMAIDDRGNLYIGGQNEIGFFTINGQGTLEYTSLVHRLNGDEKNFSTVWKTHWTKQGVYFRTTEFLFRWNPDADELKVWKPREKFNASFACAGKFFTLQRPLGLMRLVGDSFTLVPGGELFKDKKIFLMAPLPGNPGKLLIGTRFSGFYIYDGRLMTPFATEADEYLKENELYHGVLLRFTDGRPGEFALATRRGGLLIVDSNGRLKRIFNKKTGLQDDNVRYVFEDSRGNLWLALNNGIARIEYAAPFSFYDERAGLNGLVLSVLRQRDVLYAGTSRGLYVRSGPDGFQPVPGISTNCWALISVGDALLAAASSGVFLVNENRVNRIVLRKFAYVLHRSRADKNRFWVGTNQGLVSLYLVSRQQGMERQVAVERIFPNIRREIKTIAEDNDGDLWLSTEKKIILHVDFPAPGKISNPVVNSYDIPGELSEEEINVFWAAGHVVFAASDKGIYRFDPGDKRFIPDPTLGKTFCDGSRGVFRMAGDRRRGIWFHSHGENFQAAAVQSGYEILDPNPLLRLPLEQVNAIYPDPGENIVWFGCSKGLIAFHGDMKKMPPGDFSTLVREVEINRSPLFFDDQRNKYNKTGDWSDRCLEVDYENRNICFRFAAAFFEDETRTGYSYFLEGYDRDWSPWTSETRKDYTNLTPRTYIFRVKARNVYRRSSPEAVFLFRVLPPWYITWWAFLSYAVGISLLTYLLVKWRRSIMLEQETKKLEQIVKERTTQVNEKNSQLEAQTVQLTEQAEKLQEMSEIKSRFFANISHEFRTPLTLIMGPLEQILSDYRGKDSGLEKKIKLMLRNSQRLFTLINRLLELSKLDSGQMFLKTASQNIVPFLKGIVASFQLLARQYGLDLNVHADDDDITLYFDPEKVEDMLCNLLINAIKFTPGGGSIDVWVKQALEGDEHFPRGYLEISVCDTGPGIPRDQLDHIFDRFYHTDATDGRYGKGTGIGLALTRELVNLHHGCIDVRGREGEQSGTEFIIRLPLGSEHLEPREILPLEHIPPERRKPFEISCEHWLEKKSIEPGDTGAGEPARPVEDVGGGAPGAEKNIVLIIDDNDDVREYIRGALESLYTVAEAKDGQEGVRKAQAIIPDLIISDVMMPNVDGFELCETIKKDIRTSHIPVVLLTAKASETCIIQGLETGADDYVTKPFNTKILLARIKNLIELRRHFQLTLYREMNQLPVKMSISRMDEEFIKDLREVIETNLSDPDFNVEQLARKLYMSRATVYRKINALSGESPNEFIQSYRLKRGRELLKKNCGTVLEVALEVGFSSASYFTKCFRKRFKQLPSDFLGSGS
jgi:signal transduction histidine kinase/DNA-binding NarL/FixJ family response regulator